MELRAQDAHGAAVAELAHLGEHRRERAATIVPQQPTHIFGNGDFRFHLFDAARELEKHGSADVGEAFALSGVAEGLAGEAAGDDVDLSLVVTEFHLGDISLDDVFLRPISPQRVARMPVPLDQQLRLDAGIFKTSV